METDGIDWAAVSTDIEDGEAVEAITLESLLGKFSLKEVELSALVGTVFSV